MNQNKENSSLADDETSDRSRIGFWIDWVKTAKDWKERKRHLRDMEAAYAEYELAERDSEDDKQKPARGFNIYAESCWTLEPAYFAQNPKAASKRKHGIEDEIALTMALINDRLAQNLIENGNVYETMEASVMDFMHASKAAPQVVYTTDTVTQRTPLTQDQQDPEKFYDGDAVYEGDEVLNDDGGYFYNKEVANESTQRIFLMPSPIDEQLHTPDAQTEADIKERAYWFCLDYETAEKKFNTGPNGEKLGKTLPYKTSSDSKDEADEDNEKANSCKKLSGWEIYCLETKKVYWVCEDYKTDFLISPQPDPYGLKKFFPSPAYIIKNKRRKSLYPTPMWRYLEATANQLHLLYERMFDLIGAIERKAIVHGGSVELISELKNLKSGGFVAAPQVADILDKGGINKMIEWVEVRDLVEAITECITLQQHFEERFNRAFGIPDILRGISDPAETAEAQGIKSEAGHNRFKKDKKKIIELCRESVELMLDLAYKVYSDEKIARICGYEYLETGTPAIPAVPPSPENPQGTPETPAKPSHKELFFTALQRLRNDEDRLVTIDFETDSTNFRDEEREIQRATLISNTTLQGLSTIGSIQNPEFIDTALSLLLINLEAMGGSTKSENMIKRAVSDIEKRKNQPPPPPPPDARLMMVQVKEGELALKQQIALSDKAREDFKVKLEEIQIASETRAAQIEASLNQQIEGMKIALANKDQQLNEQKMLSDVAVASKELEIKTLDGERDRQVEMLKIENERRINEIFAAMEQQKIDNDRLRVQQEETLSKLRIIESLMEERRLSKESTVANVTTLIEAAKSDESKEVEGD